jgi:hypothetical protein
VPVLLLAQGDPQAKNMLRKAIEARYGLRPPALESLKLEFKGRARAKLGPLATWVPVEATARFHFPRSLRWDFIVKAVGVQVGSGAEAFDGVTYRSSHGGKAVEMSEDPDTISSIQRRLWAVAAVLLTPLGEQFVKLAQIDDSHLEATNTQFDVAVSLHLRDDEGLDYVETTCLNPDSNRQQSFTLRLDDNLVSINDLLLPGKVSAFWDDDPYFELEPVLTESNPAIAPSVFMLESD